LRATDLSQQHHHPNLSSQISQVIIERTLQLLK
jgi:hypothetical protein